LATGGPALLDALVQPVEAGEQRVKIADGRGLLDGTALPAAGRRRVVRGEGAALDAGFQQVDLERDRVVLAAEEREGAFGIAGLPGADPPLTRGGADVDSAVLGDPAPLVAAGPVGRSGHWSLLVNWWRLVFGPWCR